MKLFLIGLFLSLIYSKKVLPIKEGNYPKIKPTFYPLMYKGLVIIPYKKKAVHLHHWIFCLIVCMICFYLRKINLIFGFSLGLLFQGLCYTDAYKIICDNPY